MSATNKILFVFALIAFLAPKIIFGAGSLVISEIMYDLAGSDADHEWIEIHNTGSTPVVIQGGTGSGSYRFNDGSNHVLASTALKGSMTIPVDGYAIIAADASVFIGDYPSFTGTVIDTTMSLGNDADTVKIIDGDSNVLDSVSYTKEQGANGDGNSLQLTSTGTWISALPTPGSATTSSSSTTTDTGVGGGTTSDEGSVTKAVDTPKMKAVIYMPDNGVAGILIRNISGDVYGYKGEIKGNGIFHYSFGDGTDYYSSYGENFSHTYDYPGQYIVTLSYRSNVYQSDPEIIVRKNIDIKKPGVEISSSNTDGTIEIHNYTDEEADISGWVISNNGNRFTFPSDTVIVSGKKIILSNQILKFQIDNNEAVNLELPAGNIVSSFGGQTIKNAVVSTVDTSQKIYTVKVSSPVQIEDNSKVSAVDLQANSLNSLGETEDYPNSSNNFTWFVVGLVGVILSSFVALNYFSKEKSSEEESVIESDTKKIADNIRIIEEENNPY